MTTSGRGELDTESVASLTSDVVADIVYDTYHVIGSRMAVGTASAEVRAAVRGLLGGFGPVADGADSGLPRYALVQVAPDEWQLRIDDAIVGSGDKFLDLLGALEWNVISKAVGLCNDLFQLHAAALCAPARREGLLLIGQPGLGKTTLTLALMLSGFVPFADDLALIDPASLELRAFRRPFHVEDEMWRLIEGLTGPLGRESSHLPPNHFAPPQWAAHAAPVRWLLVLEPRRAQGALLTPMSAAEAVTATLGQSLSARRTARMALSTAARLTQEARCYRFAPGSDLADSVRAIRELVAAPITTA